MAGSINSSPFGFLSEHAFTQGLLNRLGENQGVSPGFNLKGFSLGTPFLDILSRRFWTAYLLGSSSGIFGAELSPICASPHVSFGQLLSRGRPPRPAGHFFGVLFPPSEALSLRPCVLSPKFVNLFVRTALGTRVGCERATKLLKIMNRVLL